MHIDLHLTLPRFWKVEDSHREADQLRAEIDRVVESQTSSIVHVDPCRPRDCPHCAMADCAVRDHSYLGQKNWTRHHLTAGPAGGEGEAQG